MSIAAQKRSGYINYKLFFRAAADKKDVHEVRWNHLDFFQQETGDFDSEGRVGFVGVVEVRPGDYEAFAWHVLGNSVPAAAFGSHPFSIPFSVRPGEAVYLGEFLSIATWEKNVFGMTLPGSPYFLVSDKQARDAAIAKAKTAGLPTMRNAVVNADALGSYSVRSTPRPQ